MRRSRRPSGLLGAGAVLLAVVAFGPPPDGAPAGAGVAPEPDAPAPLPRPAGWPAPRYDVSATPPTQAGVALGRALFYDPRLSRDGTISCASCHLQATGFTHADHALSHGIEGRVGRRSTLALVNLAWNPVLHWDGGVHHLDVQPLTPLTHPAEMDHSPAAVVADLNRSKPCRARFARAFRGDSVPTGQRVLLALAQFTGQFVSYRSRYDKHVRHEPGGELTEQELTGLALFRRHCAAPHRATRTLDPRLRAPFPLTANDQRDLIAFLLTLTDDEFLTDPQFGYPVEEGGG